MCLSVSLCKLPNAYLSECVHESECLCVCVVVVVVGLNQPVPTANGPGLQGSRDPFSPLSGRLGSLFYTVETVGEKTKRYIA